ncbi:uncharacterized protein JCM15063_002636 [Sporobolomyces koalae]|uniref:uncharacterized protein n=1 Tax=Sporobolomyces koalae TaxID=500713 RepID=UPI003174727A
MHRGPPPSPDKLSFTPTRSLLQPKFESYKLELPSGSSPSRSYKLDTPFQTQSLPNSVLLGPTQAQHRAKHNHLSLGIEGEIVWIESNGSVKAARIDPKTAQPSFFDVVTLPSCSPDSHLAPEYPRAVAFTSSLWLISDGMYTLHFVSVEPAILKGVIRASLSIGSSSTLARRPLHLHRADLVGSDSSEVAALLSVTTKDPRPAEGADLQYTDQPKLGAASSRLRISTSTNFEYFTIHFPADLQGRSEFEPRWTAQGADLPALVQFDSARGRYLVASSSPLATKQTTKHDTQSAEPMVLHSPKSMADGDPSASSSSPLAPKPPPFSWSQDKDSLTVAFPIPTATPTSSIRITFSRLYLTLHIASPAAALLNQIDTFTLPHVSHKKWWAEIDPHTSVWTFDREAEGRDSNFGILTLHLEKQHAGTKWTDVFATTQTADRASEHAKIEELNPEWDYEEVPETVDPSELAKISEDMEKWTRGIMEGGTSHSAEGLGHGVPTSLMGDEMDVEVDADTGRPIVLSWIEPAANGGSAHETPRIVTPHPTLPYSLLTSSLPIASPSNFSQSMTIKHDVDGLLFEPPSDKSPESYQWTHRSTFPALAFVLATKRDTRFAYHHRDEFALAIDAPAILSTSSSDSKPRTGSGNMFVYFAPADKQTKGKQMVLKVGDAGSGAVMGLAGVELEGREVAIVALCETELVILRLQ